MSTGRGDSLVRGRRCREVILHLPSSGKVKSVERAKVARLEVPSRREGDRGRKHQAHDLKGRKIRLDHHPSSAPPRGASVTSSWEDLNASWSLANARMAAVSGSSTTSLKKSDVSRCHMSGSVLASQPIKNVSDCSAREDRFWQAAPSPCRLNSACGNECCRSPGSRRAGQHDNQTTIVSHPDSLAKFEAPKSSSRMVLQLSNTDRSALLHQHCCCRALFFLQARNGRVACHASALIQRWP